MHVHVHPYAHMQTYKPIHLHFYVRSRLTEERQRKDSEYNFATLTCVIRHGWWGCNITHGAIYVLQYRWLKTNGQPGFCCYFWRREERIYHCLDIISILRLNLRDAIFDTLLMTAVNCPRMKQGWACTKCQAGMIVNGFFLCLFKSTIRFFFIFYKCAFPQQHRKRIKDPYQTPHMLVVDMGWLKLQTQLWSSAGSHTNHLLWPHI